MGNLSIIELSDGTRFDCHYSGVGATGAMIFLIYNSDIVTVVVNFGDSAKTNEMVLNPDTQYSKRIFNYTNLVHVNQESNYIRIALKEVIE